MSVREDAAAIQGELAALRRELHQIPEIGLDLPRTQEKVLNALHPLPLEVTTGSKLSSVTAVLRGGRRAADGSSPVVLLRGDMDALPVEESPGEEFVSQTVGNMHACGHDLHTAGLVGAARLLAARRDELAGDVVFMFQPGEEGWDGAGHMIDEGVLSAAGRKADYAYGIHVMSSILPRGVFACRPGPLMAASDGLFVRVIGAGGHGSRPHSALDPVQCAAEMVTALQTMVSRRIDAFEPNVITVGTFHAGTRRNIIPDEAMFEATVRSFNPEVREQLAKYTIQVCEGIAAAHGLQVEARYEQEYPVTVNDAGQAAFVADAVRDTFGEERYFEMPTPVTGSEDFSRVLENIPGAYLFLGACPTGDPMTAPSNHSPRAVFDDSVLSDGAAFLADVAMRRLG
jgi:hippurate hydrolase